MVEAKNLTKTYNGLKAVDQLNLNIQKGETFCLLGANGAGKTTTINLFLNFVQPDSGEARIDGVNVAEGPLESKKKLAYIPENLMLYPNFTGLENLEYFSGLAGNRYKKHELKAFLGRAGLQEDAFSRRVSAYSKGMRQKVGIAIAIAKKVKALLLDEPTAGLDPQASNEFARLLQALKDGGLATLMTTHDLFRAKETGTHIGIMKQGVLKHAVLADDISLPDLEKLYLDTMNLSEEVVS